MTGVLTFSLSGEPRGKGRPRATVMNGHARMYTDARTREYEGAIAAAARRAMGSLKPFSGPLSVSLRFRLQPPASMSKRQRARVLGGEEAYFGRVDLDNAAKSVLDAMNEVVFEDDKQIVRLWLTKVADERPGIDVRIEALSPQEQAA